MWLFAKIYAMKMFSLILLIMYASHGVAQIHCGTDELRHSIKNRPGYTDDKRKSQELWSKYLAAQKYSRTLSDSKDTIYEIPVVVHVIYDNDTIGTYYNPSDSRIDSGIAELNQVYEATWSHFADTNHGGVKFPFHFVLAKRDPQCNPTNGITRTDGRIY